MGNSSRPIEVILHLGFEPPIRDIWKRSIQTNPFILLNLCCDHYYFLKQNCPQKQNSISCWNFTLPSSKCWNFTRSSSKSKQQSFFNYSTRYQLSKYFNANNIWKSTWVFYKEVPKAKESKSNQLKIENKPGQLEEYFQLRWRTLRA